MKILVDTSIWSLALRRQSQKGRPEKSTGSLQKLIEEGRAFLIGPIRQEILSGVSTEIQFLKLKNHLKAFPNIEITDSDYEKAAQYFNICQSKGIQGSHTGFLICAIANTQKMKIFTADKDFTHYSKHLPIKLYEIESDR